MQLREWLMLAMLIAIPLAIAVVVTLWSIKQMAYTPKKPARPKPTLSADDLALLASASDGDARANDGSTVATGGAAGWAPERGRESAPGGGSGSV